MSNYVILTESNCDLPQELADQLGLVVLPMTVETPRGTFKNYLDGRDMDPKTFYANLRAGDVCKTSAINTTIFEETMEEFAKEGKDVLYLGFSSGLSGTYSAGLMAARELSEKYPERKFYAVDTLCASMGQGLIVYLAAQKKNEGASIEETAKYLEDIKLNMCHWFTVDDLVYLKRGGRVTPAAAAIGGVLNIKPVLKLETGKLDSFKKCRGFGKVKKTMIEAMKNDIETRFVDAMADGKLHLLAATSANEAETEAWVQEIEAAFPGMKVFCDPLSLGVSCHTGTGALGIGCVVIPDYKMED